jgi:hypothetical protein
MDSEIFWRGREQSVMADCDIEPKGEGMPMNAEQRRMGKTIVLGIWDKC